MWKITIQKTCLVVSISEFRIYLVWVKTTKLFWEEALRWYFLLWGVWVTVGWLKECCDPFTLNLDTKPTWSTSIPKKLVKWSHLTTANDLFYYFKQASLSLFNNSLQDLIQIKKSSSIDSEELNKLSFTSKFISQLNGTYF